MRRDAQLLGLKVLPSFLQGMRVFSLDCVQHLLLGYSVSCAMPTPALMTLQWECRGPCSNFAVKQT